jgi:hypothetical protein
MLVEAPECSACGRKAEGYLQINDISLYLCEACNEKINSKHEWVFVQIAQEGREQ